MANLFEEAERQSNRRVATLIQELVYSTGFPQQGVGVLTDLLGN